VTGPVFRLLRKAPYEPFKTPAPNKSTGQETWLKERLGMTRFLSLALAFVVLIGAAAAICTAGRGDIFVG
jgi:hypothetical protein